MNEAPLHDFRQHLIRYGGDVYPEIVDTGAAAATSWDATGKQHPRLHVGPDVRDARTQPSAHRRGHREELRRRAAPFQRHADPAQRWSAGASAWPRCCRAALSKSLFLNTGGESNETAIKTGEDIHRRLRGRRPRRVVARHHRRRAARVTYASGRRGYGPDDAGNASRSPSPTATAARSGIAATPATCTCLEVGFNMFDAQSAGCARRGHRRAGDERRRHHRAAGRAISNALQAVRRSAACC